MKSKKQTQPKLKKLMIPPESKDLPATQGMLHLVRTELKSDIQELRSEMNARFKEVDARFSQVDARFNQINTRFNQVDARFNQIEAGLEKIMQAVPQLIAEMARIGVLVEEQHSRNRIVLEGLTGLAQRQD